jgi:hypothetical protein
VTKNRWQFFEEHHLVLDDGESPNIVVGSRIEP